MIYKPGMTVYKNMNGEIVSFYKKKLQISLYLYFPILYHCQFCYRSKEFIQNGFIFLNQPYKNINFNYI